MRRIVDFLLLRSGATLFGISGLWVAVLVYAAIDIADEAIALVVAANRTDLNAGLVVLVVLLETAWQLLFTVLLLVLIRLLLEVAIYLLIPANRRPQALAAVRLPSRFFSLRPIFTVRGLQVLWLASAVYTVVRLAIATLQLIAALRQMTSATQLFSLISPTLHFLVYPVLTIALVRLLIGVSAKILPLPPPKKRRLPGINVLLIGAGGREHALAWKLAQSPRLKQLFAAPGNPGIGECAQIVALDAGDPFAVIDFCREFAIGLVVVGPEAPLVAGLADDLAAADIPVFGPGREAARLEGSKGYTKDLCAEAGIPTAAYCQFTDPAAAKAYIRAAGAPIVVKADGLAAGKGVTVARTVDEGFSAVETCFAGTFGQAGAEVVVEEYLDGREVSFFVLSDGEHALPFGTAEDHKRASDGDTGPNTGGMGAFSPSPLMTPDLTDRVMRDIVEPTLATLRARGAPYRGVLYAGLMLTKDGPKLIEYNVRFGDPEAQVLMMRLDADLLDVLLAAAEGRLDYLAARWSREAALTVVMAAQGYPGNYSTGTPIIGIDRADALPGVKVFQAGTGLRDGRLVSAGGRVLDVTALGATLGEARARAYGAVAEIDWADGFWRKDIGQRAVSPAPTGDADMRSR